MYKKIGFLFFVLVVLILGCSKSKPDAKVDEMLTTSMNTVDQIVQDELDRLHTIAELKDVQEGNWDFIKAALTENETDRNAALYWYSLPSGSYFTSEKDKVEANLSSRGYFPDLLAGKDVVGYPIVGKTSGRKSFVIAVPVIVEEEVYGILGTSIYLDEMWDFLNDKLIIPEKYDFYAVNTMGITMFDLETKDHLLANTLEQTSTTLVEAIKVIISTENGTVTYKWNDKKKTAVYRTSPVTNWRYVISYY
ncbi:MAG: cache domain-containing protein [Candidatus Cloacimonadales bacterium]|nr:cache domain-containing protein [Candidatus Cloacimonadales bacterium]